MALAPDEALAAINSIAQELSSVPASVGDAVLAMRGLDAYFRDAQVKIAELENLNRTLGHQLLGAEVKLDQDIKTLDQQYQDQIATLQTDVDRLQMLLQEAKAEEQWITDRMAEALNVKATNMRDLTERVVILINEAVGMVQENL